MSNKKIFTRLVDGRLGGLQSKLVLNRKPCVRDNFWCVKCKTPHLPNRTRAQMRRVSFEELPSNPVIWPTTFHRTPFPVSTGSL